LHYLLAIRAWFNLSIANGLVDETSSTGLCADAIGIAHRLAVIYRFHDLRIIVDASTQPHFPPLNI
jgi:hypothetical protein